ncbi:signal peptidase I [Photorhabdus bodei]|uniref:Signal peptidase I n=1 Tax=Photorhabdus bodei TaxID=2029681 RepID=A0AAW6BGI7_9GAMM|nr:signal peptidase I [Photorhabdus bodei]MDB6372689.1 signal peptidase I [Photorhabdus bodei]
MANTFALILTLATLVTGIIWCIDRFKWAPERKKKLARLQELTEGTMDQEHLAETINKPTWVDTCSSIFPVLAVVLILRSFVYEPFQIPSGSMMPTLLIGDFILVEKYSYGLKDPITQTTLIKTGEPKRGDVAVFKYPLDPSFDYIKRVVGLPGDKIIYDPAKKELRIFSNCSKTGNCQGELPVSYGSLFPSEWTMQQYGVDSKGESLRKVGVFQIPVEETLPPYSMRQGERIENLDAVTHHILEIPGVLSVPNFRQPGLPEGMWIVPEGHYFMMGDNRDNSADSRAWGFVPEKNLVGRASAIWMSFEKQEGEWPTGVRFSRIGGIN